MKRTILAAALGALFLAGPGARAQVVSSPGYAVRPFVTPPPMTHPRVPSTHDKRLRGKAQVSQGQGRFIPLNPASRPTPVRVQKIKRMPPYQAGAAPGPRQVTYPTHLVTPIRPHEPPRVKALPSSGAISVMGPRQLQYHTLYQNPTPVN